MNVKIANKNPKIEMWRSVMDKVRGVLYRILVFGSLILLATAIGVLNNMQ